MIKPERMSRIAIAGPRMKLDAAVRSLYELNLLHVVDYVSDDPEVKIGIPSPGADTISQRLIRLRSIIRALHLDDYRPDRKISVEEIERTTEQAIVTLDLEVTKKVEVRQTLGSRIRELGVQNDALAIFDEIGLPLQLYSEYDNLAVLTGTSQDAIEGKIKALDVPTDFIEIQSGARFASCVFCKKKDVETIQPILNGSGYQELKPPFKSGTAKEHIKSNSDEISKLQRSLDSEQRTIDELREKYAPLVLASEEHYSIEIQQAEAPLRIATTKNSFAIDGWVPLSSVDSIKLIMKEKVGENIAVEVLPVSKHEEDEHAPVKLKNPRIAKPFELFIELMSTPLYREADPTLFVFAIFPLFFGLMIGDFGYGSCLMLAGYVMFKKLGKDSDGWRRLGLIVFAGGLFAAVFGLLLFCEAFGLPFHPTHKYPLSWEGLGIFIPLEAHMEKLIAVGDFLAISIIAAWLHLSFGYVVGFFNELKQSKKRAAMKIIWLIILQAFCLQILLIGSDMGNQIARMVIGLVGAPFTAVTLSFSGIGISGLSLGLILFGIVSFFVMHGKAAMMEILEILSLLANIISYARIAAIGVAKGATAYAFNSIVATYFLSGGDILIGIIGVVVLVLLQLIVFALGSLSAGIQALRLNYVEFFLKFFNGGGVSFEPLGYKRKYSEKTEA